MSLDALVGKQWAEWSNLQAMLSVTPKQGRGEVMRQLTETLIRHREEAEAFNAETAPATLPVVNTFNPLPPIEGIFDGVVWGENKTAFVQLEHLVNEMRENATTYRIGLYGPPSCGKTMTAGKVARALERRYYEGSARFLGEFPTPISGLVTLVDRLHDGLPVLESYVHEDGRSNVDILAPSVFFIDEAHEMPMPVQYALLPITEKPYRAPFGEGYVDFRHIMFIFGTTDPAQLFKPLRTRCEPVPFVGYSVDSVAEIVRMSYPEMAPQDALMMARAGKLYPRRALSVARTCSALASKYGSPEAVLTEHMGIDSEGLDPTDRRILEALDATVLVPDPRKVDAARTLLRLVDEGQKANANQVAAARTILDNPKVHRPIGKSMLAEKIMSTDTQDIFERVTYLEMLGKVFQSSRGVQLAV